MMHDIFIPCRIGNYYLHTTRVLSLEVTPLMVQAVLLEYSGSSVTLKHNVALYLKDGQEQTQLSAIKKIMGIVGKVDEVVAPLLSSAIIFKELELPFLGRENLKLVIPFEVESKLPFSLQDALIDFMVIGENHEKKSSTVLVAAVRKEDVQAQYDFFEKAQLSLSSLTVDVFALFYWYKLVYLTESALPKLQSSWLSRFRMKLGALIQGTSAVQPVDSLASYQPKRSEILIDIGCDSIKMLYIHGDRLQAVRVIPFGIFDTLHSMMETLNVSQHDLAVDLLSVDSSEKYLNSFAEQMQPVFNEISRTVLYFQQQAGSDYIQPYKILVSGYAVHKNLFVEHMKKQFGSIVQQMDSQHMARFVKVKITDKDKILPQQTLLMATCIVAQSYPDNNLLQDLARKTDNRLLYMQLFAMICASLICLGGVWLRSSQELQKWQTAYSVSRKQFISVLETDMGISLKNERSLTAMVEKAEETLKRERNLWSKFMKHKEVSVLEYLQDLSLSIDRVAIGLDLKQMHLDYEKVTMTGSVKSFETLDVFDEELQGLKLLAVTEKPRELSWTIQLQPKQQKGSV